VQDLELVFGFVSHKKKVFSAISVVRRVLVLILPIYMFLFFSAVLCDLCGGDVFGFRIGFCF